MILLFFLLLILLGPPFPFHWISSFQYRGISSAPVTFVRALAQYNNLMIKCSWDKNNNEITLNWIRKMNREKKKKLEEDKVNKRMDGTEGRGKEQPSHHLKNEQKEKEKERRNQDKRIKDQTVLMSDDHVSMKSGWFTFIDFDFGSSGFFSTSSFIDIVRASTPRLFPPRFLYHSQANYFSFVVIIVFFCISLTFNLFDGIFIEKKHTEKRIHDERRNSLDL